MPEPQPREGMSEKLTGLVTDEMRQNTSEFLSDYREPDDTHRHRDAAVAERDHWIRLFNRLEGAVAHWRKEIDKVSDAGIFAYDEALAAAHDRVLKEATKGA